MCENETYDGAFEDFDETVGYGYSINEDEDHIEYSELSIHPRAKKFKKISILTIK